MGLRLAVRFFRGHWPSSTHNEMPTRANLRNTVSRKCAVEAEETAQHVMFDCTARCSGFDLLAIYYPSVDRTEMGRPDQNKSKISLSTTPLECKVAFLHGTHESFSHRGSSGAATRFGDV